MAILKVTSVKINRLLPMATINMHMKFEIEIPKQTWLMLWKPCHLQTDGRMDRRTDRQTRWIQYTPPPPPTSLGGGINLTKKNIIEKIGSITPNPDPYKLLHMVCTQLWNTMWCAVNFLTDIHKTQPKARPLGWHMGFCWIQHLIDILPQPL